MTNIIKRLRCKYAKTIYILISTHAAVREANSGKKKTK